MELTQAERKAIFQTRLNNLRSGIDRPVEEFLTLMTGEGMDIDRAAWAVAELLRKYADALEKP